MQFLVFSSTKYIFLGGIHETWNYPEPMYHFFTIITGYAPLANYENHSKPG